MTETAQLTASDGAADDDFGISVSISDNTVVVGARRHDTNGNTNQGKAYVFERPTNGWSDMTETAQFTASDGARSDRLGISVSISGNTVMVSAPINSSSLVANAYFFSRNSAPTIAGTPSTSISVNQTYSFTPTASDIDVDDLSFTISNKPSWTSFNETTGNLSGMPTSEGTFSNIEICVSDGRDTACLDPFSITVTEPMVPPEQIVSTNFATNTARLVSEAAPAVPSITLDKVEEVRKVVLNYGTFRQGIFTDSLTQNNINQNEIFFTLPISTVDEIGVAYQFSVYGANNNLLDTSTIGYAYISHENEGLNFPNLRFGTEQSAYQLISLPLEKENTDLLEVFDELAPYDDTKWRLFEYTTTGNKEKKSGTLERGKGYWFIKSTPVDISTGAGSMALPNNEAFGIALDTGWNLIGNPYTFSVSMEDIRTYAKNCDITFNTEATITYNDGNLITQNATELRPYEGVFIKVDSPDTLYIPYELNMPTCNTGGRIAAPLSVDNPIDAPAWWVPLHIQAGGLRNELGGLGMHPLASINTDDFDGSNVPRFQDYIDVNFKDQTENIAKDITATASEYTWAFEVQTSLIGEEVTLEWDNTYFGDNGKTLWLLDERTKQLTDMRLHKNYSFTGEASRPFSIYFGDLDQLQATVLPEQASLGMPYPNPNQGFFKVPFILPKGRTSYQVSLTLHDVAGKQIAEILQEKMPAGLYEASIDENLAKGVYLLKLTVDDKKVVSQQVLIYP